MPQLLCLITVYLHTKDSKRKKTLLIFSVHCSSTPGGQTQSLTMAQTRLSISGGWAQYRRLGEHITALVTGHSRVHTHSFAVWLTSISSKVWQSEDNKCPDIIWKHYIRQLVLCLQLRTPKPTLTPHWISHSLWSEWRSTGPKREPDPAV